MNIPFFSVENTFNNQWNDISNSIKEVVQHGELVNGEMVKNFEQKMETYTSAKYAIAVGNASDAIIIALKALGIGEGDEVIVPCYTFFSSASSIAHVGAKPVFVDIDPLTYCVNTSDLEDKINSSTKAIMPVHLFSQMANMTEVLEIADKYNLMVLEDSAEGIGMFYDGTHAGLIGDVGVLSFFPTKTLGAIGDAGIILTNDNEIAKKCRILKNNGKSENGEHLYEMIGFNSNMDDIQAAVLYNRLNLLTKEIKKRKELAIMYSTELGELSSYISIPKIDESKVISNYVFYVYLIRAKSRDELVSYLSSHGIDTETYYPTPLHLQPSLNYLGYRNGDFPAAENASSEVVALPLYPDLEEDQLLYVCKIIKEFYTTISKGKENGNV